MTTADAKSFLVIFRHPPGGSALAREALDVALASAAFVNRLEVLFLDDGVWQLAPGSGSGTDAGSFAKTLQALPVYGVSRCHVHLPSLEQRGIRSDAVTLDCEPADDAAVARMIDTHDVVLSF